MDVPLDVKAANPPSADDLAKGDPSGTKTGTVNDIVMSDTKKGLTLADVVNQIGQNRIAINFTWTLVAGFLVMFMQAGFAIVETGLCRAKNAQSHHDDEFHGLRLWLVCLSGCAVLPSRWAAQLERLCWVVLPH